MLDLKVPSLYVRVYRMHTTRTPRQQGSLIICEGVSTLFFFGDSVVMFPHYM